MPESEYALTSNGHRYMVELQPGIIYNYPVHVTVTRDGITLLNRSYNKKQRPAEIYNDIRSVMPMYGLSLHDFLIVLHGVLNTPQYGERRRYGGY